MIGTYSGQVKAVDMELPAPESAEREALRERALRVAEERGAAFQRATQRKGAPMTYAASKRSP